MVDSDSKTSGTKSAPIIIQSEGSPFNAGIVLDETNYDLWSQIMEMHIAEKEKLSFIRGNSQSPTEKDDGYEKWYADNQKVKRWLLMSVPRNHEAIYLLTHCSRYLESSFKSFL